MLSSTGNQTIAGATSHPESKVRHPFEVDERYRNRHDAYRVVSLDGSKMVIQYTDGTLLETTVEMQARIWRNIQVEERVQALQAERRKKQSKFRGLQAHDFQRGVRGTSWRARTSLGGLLARRMSQTTPYTFRSYVIRRQPRVHIVQPKYYRRTSKSKSAKFVLELDTGRARYGFHVEKNDGPMDDTWDWLAFSTTLEKDKTLQEKVEAAAGQFNLRWKVCVKAGDELIDQWTWPDKAEGLSWPDWAERLGAIKSDRWANVYLCTSMPKEQAIAAGVHLVDPVTEVYRALLPLYEASTR